MTKAEFQDKVLENMMLFDDAIKLTLSEADYDYDENEMDEFINIISQIPEHQKYPTEVYLKTLDKIYAYLPHQHDFHCGDDCNEDCEECQQIKKEHAEYMHELENDYKNSRW